MDDIGKLMVEQIRDIHSAERQQSRFMPKVMRKVTSPALKEALQAHAEETESQIERLDQALEKLGGKSGRKVCEGMRGLLEEAQHELDEYGKGPILDCVMIASIQRAEHYEIAAYGSLISLARAAGEAELADSMAATLDEEKRADAKLSEIAEQEVNAAAVASIRSEEDGADEDAEDDEAAVKPANENPRGRKRKAS